MFFVSQIDCKFLQRRIEAERSILIAKATSFNHRSHGGREPDTLFTLSSIRGLDSAACSLVIFLHKCKVHRPAETTTLSLSIKLLVIDRLTPSSQTADQLQHALCPS